jgi:spermidine/putrescine transport system permease protein
MALVEGARRRRRRASQAFLVLPAWAWLVFFFFAPVTLVLWYSFGEKPGLFGTHSNETLTLDRYREALSGPFGTTFRNTLEIGLLGTGLCLLIGFPFAYWLAMKVSSRWRGVLIALVMVPFWTNFLVRTIGWRLILSPEGELSALLQKLQIIGEPLAVLYTRTAVQIGVVYNYLPLMVLPIFVALDRMDRSLLRASRDLGANRWTTAWRVTLPMCWPGIAAGSLLVFIPLMGDYITATVLGGARGNMIGQLVASQFQTAQNWALGSAMAVVLILVILGTALALAVLLLLLRAAGRRHRRLDLRPGGVA